MLGRTEDKIKYERKMQEKIADKPAYMTSFYYYLNNNTYLTKTRYINQVLRFLNFYGNGDINNVDTKELAMITEDDIQRYIMSIQFVGNKELSNDAKAQIYSSLKTFMEFLVGRDLLERNPFDRSKISRPKPKENEITYLEPEEYAEIRKRIMNGVGTDRAKAKQKKWMYRDLLLFEIPIVTGVRVTALSQIALSDIDFEEKTIKVIDKAKEKKLYLDERIIGLLNIWLEQREELMKGYEDQGYIFISNQRTKLEQMSIERIIKKYADGINGKHITPHKLRSTCGTNLYRETKDIYLVAEVLGHSSVATSKKYTKIDNQSRVNAAELLSKRMHGGV